MSTISPQTRRELVTAVAGPYQRSTPAETGRILDEFVALTGYHRKHAIRVLNGSSAPRHPPVSVAGGDTDNGSEFLNEVLIGFCRGARHRADAVEAVSEERPGPGSSRRTARSSAD